LRHCRDRADCLSGGVHCGLGGIDVLYNWLNCSRDRLHDGVGICCCDVGRSGGRIDGRLGDRCKRITYRLDAGQGTRGVVDNVDHGLRRDDSRGLTRISRCVSRRS
jgi:hypothetical protein